MPQIIETLERLKQQVRTPLTQDIELALTKITTICNSQYYNQSFYGNAALNRQMLLNPDIAGLLTPNVLAYIFTNEPTDKSKISRNSSPGGKINLKDAIYYGFKEGLQVIRLMPNNEKVYGPDAYREQHKKFITNTMRIVENIKLATDVSEIEYEQKLNPDDLLNQYERIIEIVDQIKQQDLSDTLLSVPGYTPKDMRRQVLWGLGNIYHILKMQDLKKETLDNVCEKFLNSPDAMLNGNVIHLFYDRAHIEAALEQDTKFQIGTDKYTFRDIFSKMIQKVSANPQKYPPCAKEQFCLRFGLVESDLRNRFQTIYDQVVARKVVVPATQIPTPTSNNYGTVGSNIDKILGEFENKIKSIGSYHLDAKNKATELLKILRDNKNQAFQNPSVQSLETFLSVSKQAIKNITPTLQRDLGWGDYLANMAKQLVNAVSTGFAYIATLGTSKHHGFFALKCSDAVNESQALAEALEGQLGQRINRVF